MRNMQKSGQILWSKKRPRPTLRSGRGSRTNFHTSHQIPARVIEANKIILDIEMNLHVKLCAGWGLSPSDPEQTPPAVEISGHQPSWLALAGRLQARRTLAYFSPRWSTRRRFEPSSSPSAKGSADFRQRAS